MKTVITLFLIFLCSNTMAKTVYPEKYYQKIKCDELGGITEYVLSDRTRVDCLTDAYAIEFDFAHKWAESVGQALFYAIKTNRRPAIALILENPTRDMKYTHHLADIATKYDITV